MTPQTVSSRRLNILAQRMPRCQEYLEIGVEAGATLENVDVARRTGVDPRPLFDTERLPENVEFYSQTSDSYFESTDTPTFDLVFVDGLHVWWQAYRDVINSLNRSHSHAVVLLDDCVPADELSALPSMSESYERREAIGDSSRAWCGDVYKVLYVIHFWHPELAFATATNECGEFPQAGQALVWRRPNAAPLEIREFSAEELAAVEAISWSETFGSGKFPGYLNVMGEEDAIQRAVAESWRSWHSSK